jgi:Tfp pilus assembly protein PilV
VTQRRTSGFAVVEALVALLLAAVSVAGLAAAAAASVRHVRVARERGAALALAADRLEALRGGPRDRGRDELDVAGTRYVRTWTSDGGRGAPVRLEVEVVWPDGHVRLETGAYP